MRPYPTQRFETPDFVSSAEPRTSPEPHPGTPARSSDKEDTPPRSFSALGISRLSIVTEPRLEMPQFIVAEDKSLSTPLDAEMSNPAFPTAPGHGQVANYRIATAQPLFTRSTQTYTPQHVSSRERLFAQRLPLASETNNMPSPNNVPSPHPLDSPLTVNIGRTTKSPMRSSVSLQTNDNDHGPSMPDIPLHSPLWPSTPMMTPQSAVSFGFNVPPQPLNMIGGRRSVQPSPQQIPDQSDRDAREELRLHQERIRIAHRFQQQQAGPVQSYLPAHTSQQVSSQMLHGPHRVEQPARQQSQQRTFNSTNARTASQMHVYPPGDVASAPSLSNSTGSLDHGKRRLPYEDNRAVRRVRNGDLRDPPRRTGLESPDAQQIVPAPSTRSGLPSAHPDINLGRQHALQQQRAANYAALASSSQQRPQQTPPFGSTDDMPVRRQNSASSPPQLQVSQLEVLKAQRLRAQSQARHALQDGFQHRGAPTRAQTPLALQLPHLNHGATSPKYPQKPPGTLYDRAQPRPKSPTELPSGKGTTTSSPPTCPQSHGSNSLPEDVFASMLQAVVDNAKGTASVTKQQEEASELVEPHELLLVGPLTKEQNSKALVEGIKEDMKRRGHAVGTNPDLDTAASPRFIQDQRKKWTEKFMRAIIDSCTSESYVQASEVMESAGGYKLGL